MQGYQGGVLLLGGALGVTELFARKVPQNAVWALQSGSLPMSNGTAKSFWTSNGGAVILTIAFVGATVYIAGLGDDAGKLMLALIIAVWILFLIKNSGNLNSIFTGVAADKVTTWLPKKGM